MDKLLELLGNIVGVVGVLLCVVAGVMRLTGKHMSGGFESLTLFQGGMAAMIFACLCLLLVLAKRTR